MKSQLLEAHTVQTKPFTDCTERSSFHNNLNNNFIPIVGLHNLLVRLNKLATLFMAIIITKFLTSSTSVIFLHILLSIVDYVIPDPVVIVAVRVDLAH